MLIRRTGQKGLNSTCKKRSVSKTFNWFCLSIALLAFSWLGFVLLEASRKSTSRTLSPPIAHARTYLDVPTNYRQSCGDGLWHGTFEALNVKSYLNPPPVSIAIAFCEHSLSWLDHLIQGLNVRNITIYSKCGSQVRNISHPTRIVKLTNVGRVDHAYVYHMANLPEDTDPDEVQLFLKDTYPEFHQIQLRRRSLHGVVHEAAGTTGFSCGSVPKWRNTFNTTSFPSKTWFHSLLNYGSEWSAWHLSSEVAKFGIRNYRSAGGYTARDDVDFAGNLTFQDWFDALHLRMPDPVMPVCYAGTFAVKPKNILTSRRIWSRMLKLLERGDNIIEGHYAERTYAAVLMPNLPLRLQERIIHLSTGFRPCSYTAGFCGSLYGCSESFANT